MRSQKPTEKVKRAEHWKRKILRDQERVDRIKRKPNCSFLKGAVLDNPIKLLQSNIGEK